MLFVLDGWDATLSEYLVNAQGEDVVAGIRTPEDILTMKEALPSAYDELVRNTQLLVGESHAQYEKETRSRERKKGGSEGRKDKKNTQ